MTEREFCYWLQGLFEVGRMESLDVGQVQIIKDHLALVFSKVTPDRTPGKPIPLLNEYYRRQIPDRDHLTRIIC